MRRKKTAASKAKASQIQPAKQQPRTPGELRELARLAMHREHVEAVREAETQAARLRLTPRIELNDDLIEAVCKLVGRGFDAITVAMSFGVSRTTWLEWRRRGKQAIAEREAGREPARLEHRYMKLENKLERAKGRQTTTLVDALLRKATIESGGAKWIAWLLERYTPEVFHQQTQLDVMLRQSSAQDATGQSPADAARLMSEKFGSAVRIPTDMVEDAEFEEAPALPAPGINPG